MKCINYLLLVAAFCMFSNCIKAQVSLETFFDQIKYFVNAEYSNKNLKAIKQLSDSSYKSSDGEKKIKQLWYRGKLVTREGVIIKFLFFASEFTEIDDIKSEGTILLSYNEGCNASLLRSSLQYIPKYNISFDTIKAISGVTCSCEEVRLHFDNYKPSSNKVLENVDTSISKLLKHEYFDFYFTDLNRESATWRMEFRNFMQPYSEVLISLLRKKNIQGVFEIIALKNKGYSWFLSEGLWYYNSIHPCLTKEQENVVESYNGKNGMFFFRSADELRKLYKF